MNWHTLWLFKIDYGIDLNNTHRLRRLPHIQDVNCVITYVLNITICHEHIMSSTHWGRVTHICVSKITTIGSDNGLSPGRRQAIIWTNAGILLIGPLRTNFSEILIEIDIFSFKKMHLKLSSAKRRPFVSALTCLGLNVRGPSYLGWIRSISWV